MGATQSIIGAKFFQKKQEEKAAPIDQVAENSIVQPNSAGELNLGDEEEDLDLGIDNGFLDFELTSNTKNPTPKPKVEELDLESEPDYITVDEILAQIVQDLDDNVITSENINDKIVESGGTRLHMAVSNGQPDIYNRLITLGASLDAKDNDGETPLHWAARTKPLEDYGTLEDYETAEDFKAAELEALETFKNAKLKALEACEALIAAFTKAHPEKLLSDYLDIENKSLENALFAPAEQGDLAICELLLKHGIEPNSANIDELTAYGIACENEKTEENPEGLLDKDFLKKLEEAISEALAKKAEAENVVEGDEILIEPEAENDDFDDNWLDEDVSPSSAPSASQNKTTNVSNGRAAQDKDSIILK